MNQPEINTLDHQELQARIIAERENLRRLRFAHAISPIENPMRIKHTRKLIAKLSTAKKFQAFKSQSINGPAQKA